MSFGIAISPAGRLFVEALPELAPALEEKWSARLHQAFEASAAEGLLWLATEALTLPVPPGLAYWRDFARRYLQGLCHLGCAEGEAAPPLPAAPGELAEFTLQAPPMRGGEFLSPR